jgi:hypothetical protein
MITIIGAETVLPYNRIMLSPVLAGEKGFDEIRTHDEAYFAQNNLIFKPGFALKPNSFNPLAASSPSKPVPITVTFLDFPASDCIYSTS